MNRAAVRLSALAFALAAGCVRFEAHPLAPEVSADTFEARSLTDPGLRSFLADAMRLDAAARPDRAWTLDELTAVALYFRADFALARRKADSVRAAVAGTREVPNPTASVSPGRNTSSSGISPWIVGAGLGFPLETAGKRRHRTAEAMYRAEAADLAVASAAWQTRRDVRDAFLSLAEARETARAAAEAARAGEALTQAMERQHAAGETSPHDLSAARVAGDRARMAAAEAAGRESVALARLGAALGLPTAAVEGIRLESGADPATAEEPDSTRARRAAMTGRADLLAALAVYAASQSALQREIAGQYPNLELGPGYEFDQGDNKWSLGLTLTLPLFNRNRAAIAGAQARREEAADDVRALQERIAGEVDAALAELRSARDQAAAADALLDAANHRMAAVEALHDAGDLAGTDVLAARAEAAQIRIEALAPRWACRRALGMLEDALQRPADLPASLWKNVPPADPARPPNERHP